MTLRVGQPAAFTVPYNHFGQQTAPQGNAFAPQTPSMDRLELSGKRPAVINFSGTLPQFAGRNVLWASPERFPAKVGGLGEISKIAPEMINRHTDNDVRPIVPYLAPLKAEGGWEKTGLSKTLKGFDGENEKFDLYQKTEKAEDGTETVVYAIGNPRYTEAHPHLYFPKGKDTEAMGDDAIFKGMMMFNRAVEAFRPELDGSTEAPDGTALKKFDGDCDIVMTHDWLTGSLLSQIPEAERQRLGLLFMFHNNFDEKRSQEIARENQLTIPKELGGNDDFSPLRLGVQLSDGVIANLNYARTNIFTKFSQGKAFVSHLLGKFNAGKVYDMHHPLDKQYDPRNNPALRDNGFTELTGDDWGAFKSTNRVALQRSLGLKEDSNAVMVNWISRFDPNQKGFYLVLNEMKDMLRRHPDLQLVVAGTSLNPDNKISQSVAAMKAEIDADPELSGRLVLPGFVNRETVAQINAGSDFSMMPSLYEPYGMTQLEAIALGALPLAHGVDGLRTTVSDPAVRGKGQPEKVWDYGQTGVLMKPLDVPAYRKAISKFDKDQPLTWRERLVLRRSQKRFHEAVERAVKLARDPQQMQAARVNGARYLTDHHNEQAIAQRYDEIFEDVLAKKAQQRQSSIA